MQTIQNGIDSNRTQNTLLRRNGAAKIACRRATDAKKCKHTYGTNWKLKPIRTHPNYYNILYDVKICECYVTPFWLYAWRTHQTKRCEQNENTYPEQKKKLVRFKNT